MEPTSTIQIITIAALPLIFGITLHEAAHGWMASQFGDKTALMMGRVTLNPLKHIDLMGTIIVPLTLLMLSGFIFGWAKPVPITQQNLHHPKRDMALVALAGPAANFIMAVMWAGLAKISLIILTQAAPAVLLPAAHFFLLAGKFGLLLNSVLLVLNLMPIPPLDGSRVLSAILPGRWSALYDRLEPFGLWILILLLAFGMLRLILFPPVFALTGFISHWFGLPI